MKKRIFAAILAAAMMMSLVACGTETSVSENVEASVEATSASVEEATEEAVEEVAEETEDVVTAGVTEDGVYTNEFFGFKLVAADGYAFTETEGTDCYIADETALKNVNVTIALDEEGAAQKDLEAFLDAMLPELKKLYEGIGYTDVTVEKETTEFAGKEYSGVVVGGSMDADGTAVELFARQVCIVKDGYIATITATSFVEDATEELLKMGVSLN